MLIKSADDQGKRIALLGTLRESARLDAYQRKWLDDELWALRLGRSGERNAAYYLDHSYKDSANLALIHDLRLEMDGEVAQIDHLIISRGFVFYLLETKNFSGNLSISERGEFTVHYASGSKGIPSPLEQGKRHEKILVKWLERLGIVGRINSKPQFVHVVLIDPKGTIRRPEPSKFNTDNVVKADQFDAWRQRHVEKDTSVLQTLVSVANLRASDTVREWAEKIVRQHRPADPLWLPDFMKPGAPLAVPVVAESGPLPYNNAPTCAKCGSALSQAEVNFCRNHAHRFGSGIYCRRHQGEFSPSGSAVAMPSTSATQEPPRRRLVCMECGAAISRAEGLFCWRNEKRFGGQQYCRTHQANFPV